MNIGKCMLINAYSFRNAGDAAIMIATANLARDLGAEAVTISSRYDDGEEYSRFGIDLIPELITFPSRGAGSTASRLLRFSASALAAMIVIGANGVSQQLGRKLLRTVMRGAAKSLSEFDSLVIAGGGYMYSSKRALNLSLLHSLISVRLAQVALPTTLMMPQSIGPVRRRFDAGAIDWALKHTSVVVRERDSIEASSHPPKAGACATQIPDVAFYLPVEAKPLLSTKTIRLVVMDWRWSSSVDPQAWSNYTRGFAHVADALTDSGYSVIIGGHSSLPEHDQDDIAVANEIASLCTSPVEVDQDCDVEHLVEEYGRAALVIGTRLHSCIMAISQGTPAVAIAYQEKSLGVMKSSGLADYVFRVDDLDAELVLATARAALEASPERWSAVSNALRAEIRAAYAAQLSAGQLEPTQ